MNLIRRRYYRFLLGFLSILCAVCLALSYFAILGTETVHVRQTNAEIFAIKREFIRDTVHNILSEIDMIREGNRLRANKAIAGITNSISAIHAQDPEHSDIVILELLKNAAVEGSLNIRFDSGKESKPLLETPAPKKGERYTKSIKLAHGTLKIGVNEDWVDANAKEIIAKIIHEQKFGNGAYIWVNEVKNWSGGDDYAIRRIHPNLKDTEGSSLSTSMTDIKGNFPYLTELEGVRDNGEIYFTYFFKKLNTDEIGEKLTYATLYQDFDWIVSMGIYLEDIQIYIDAVRQETGKIIIRILAIAGASIAVIFLIAFFVLAQMEKWYMKTASRSIRIESNTDPLTGALNRRIGDSFLGDAFKRFTLGRDSPMLLSFDIDNFKRVNDTWGHDAGDIVLKTLVSHVKKNKRSTDFLFRWGGEEFLLVCPGITEEQSLALAQKLNEEISQLPIIIGEQTLYVTVSIGISSFKHPDVSPLDAVKRADEAMYEAKAAGKNYTRTNFS